MIFFFSLDEEPEDVSHRHLHTFLNLCSAATCVHLHLLIMSSSREGEGKKALMEPGPWPTYRKPRRKRKLGSYG
jgi:hypothetical protein